MPDVTPDPQTDHDRIVVLQCAVGDLQRFHQDRIARDRWIIATLIGLAGVVVLLVVSYLHP